MRAEERLKLIVAAGALLLCIFYFFVHAPLQEKCRENEEAALQLREEKVAVQNFQNAHLDQVAYKEELAERLARADKALPAHLSQGEFLNRLQADAFGAGLKLEEALPRERQAVEEHCVALPVQLKVAGDYFELLDFLQRLRKEERFYQLKQIKVDAKEGAGRLEAEMLLVMFAEEI